MAPTVPAGKSAAAKQAYNATVIQRIDVTPRLIILQVRPDRSEISFKAGQFIVLGLKRSAPRVPEADPEEVPPEKMERLVRRSYSISSSSRERDYLEFYISMVSSGELTPRLFHLQAGDRLFLGPEAKGVFTLDRVPEGKNILLVGTGTGLAPYVSMMRTQALGLSCPVRRMAVLHGASYSWDLGYRGELESLDRHCKTFRYLPIITRPQQDRDWQGRTGRLNDWVDRPELADLCGFPLDPGQTHIFLCGHPLMVEESARLLTGKGFDAGTRKEPGNLHLEKYW